MIALDLDGTLLDYSPEGPEPAVNHAVIARLVERKVAEVAILTNQGGLPFGVAGKLRRDGRPYPTPRQFAVRLAEAIQALWEAGIEVEAVRVSCWHQYAAAHDIQRAASRTRYMLSFMGRMSQSTVYTTAAARKLNPLMLHSVGATEYWGDSDEDEQAAANAGIPFVRVKRFFGEATHAAR